MPIIKAESSGQMEQVINETGRVEVMRGIRNQDKTEKKYTTAAAAEQETSGVLHNFHHRNRFAQARHMIINKSLCSLTICIGARSRLKSAKL